MALIEDDGIYPVMVELSACFCKALRDQGFDEPCFCGVLPEGQPALDFCGGGSCDGGCPGQAWVRLVSAHPYRQSILTPASAESSCRSPFAYQLEIGFTHCAPQPLSDGTPPSMEAQLEAVRVQTAALKAMRRAMACCFGSDDRAYALGQYVSGENQGGCLSATWTLTVGDQFA